MSTTVKYTKSGKKVAVLGKLNDTQWIVQEIFAANGQEFPGGANFVESSLLDVPAETWQAKQLRETEARRARVEAEIEELCKRMAAVKVRAEINTLINKCVKSYPGADIAQLDTLFAFMAGEITHVVVKTWGKIEIATIDDVLGQTDNWHGVKSVDGLKLVSLFGVRKDGGREGDANANDLAWRINVYRDGSGHNDATVWPCRSHSEAVSVLDREVGNEPHISEHLIALKSKYGLANPSPEKIAAYTAKKIADKAAEIERDAAAIAKKREELAKMEAKHGR